ncbi:hypothetical protein [Zavarzinia aquatilis]|uniref:Uncharacterized protein n=1 Tax=Zavarzinia aquatilis TaxID=2211142 RepID=A0A317EC23_9PROT|nr:hypothetical protein [Zavarzinia aquatilis]PWR22883.1 hypothetical protein DKG74_10710 [Zavarzinia aquatilis]
MNLREVLRFQRDWSEDETIYAVGPWSADADALLSSEPPGTTDPIIQSGKPYAYFLEGFIARDFLDDLDAPDDVSETVCERLIRYAIDDA